MDSPNPLLPAFQILWNAAKSEYQNYIASDYAFNGKYGTSKHHILAHGKVENPSEFQKGGIFESESTSDTKLKENFEKLKEKVYEESVVVSTFECDHGAKFVKQIIHEGNTKTEWSRAEDLFADWINSELTSQHAQRIDVTIYFCHVPISTCSYGICLWLKKLQSAGKEINIKIKIASLGPGVTRFLENVRSPNSEYQETQDSIKALRRLAKMNAKIERISAEDWMLLISLLTDRASLLALDLKKSPNTEGLTKILQGDL